MVFACPRTLGWIGVLQTPIIQRLRRLEVLPLFSCSGFRVVIPHDRFCPRRSSLLSSGAFLVDGGGFLVILSFQTLCNLYLHDACRVEDFSALYTMKKTKENARFFGVKSSREKLIVSLADNDHGWHNTVICISGTWETTQQRE